MTPRTLAALLTAMTALSIALPAADADHGYVAVKPLIDAGITIVVTEDGLPPADTSPGPNLWIMSAAEYKAKYEHDEDPLQSVRLLPPPADDDGVEPMDDIVPKGAGEISINHHGKPAIGWGAECYWTSVDYYCETTIRPASDWRHAPSGGCSWDKTVAGIARFESTFSQIRFEERCVISSCWDAGNLGTSIAVGDLLSDFANDVLYGSNCSPRYQSQRFQTSFGWVTAMDHNGGAWRNDWFAVATSYYCSGCAKWDNDEIVQHEMSHLFNADDRNPGSGIMNYWDAYWGASHWAQPDYDIVGNNLKGCSNCYGTNVGDPS